MHEKMHEKERKNTFFSDFVPYLSETLRFAAKALFHTYGTAPWPQIKWFLGGMEQNPGRGLRGGGFWTDPCELELETRSQTAVF